MRFMPETPTTEEGYEVIHNKAMENICYIETVDGVHTLLYGHHNEPLNPNQLPNGCDGVILENALSRWTENPEQLLVRYRERDVQYRPLFPVLEKKNIPIYFADPHVTRTMLMGENFAVGLEAVGATYLLGTFHRRLRQYTEKSKDRKPSRRDMIKLTIRGAIGAFLATPLTSEIANFASYKTRLGQRTAAGYQRFCHAIHPEYGLMTIKIRDALIAYKAHWLMQNASGVRYLTTILGPDHVEIENRIQSSPEDTLAFLRRGYVQNLLKVFPVPETLYSVMQFRFDGDRWKKTATHEIPELKTLVSPQE